MIRRGLALLMVLVATWALPAAAQELTGRFSLNDHDGRRVTERSYAGKIRVVSFGYTFCPDVCPTTLATIAGALDQLGPEAARVAPLFITVDPQRDTAAHLKEYVAAFGPSFIGLTGTREMVADAAFNFKARYRIHKPADAADPNTYFVDHSAGIFIMDRQGGFVAKLGHMATPDELAERLREVLAR